MLLEPLDGLTVGLVAPFLGGSRALLAGGDVVPGGIRLGCSSRRQLLEVQLDRLRLPVGPLIGGATLPEAGVIFVEDALSCGALGLQGRDRGEHGENGDRHRDAGREPPETLGLERLPFDQLLWLELLASHRAKRVAGAVEVAKPALHTSDWTRRTPSASLRTPQWAPPRWQPGRASTGTTAAGTSTVRATRCPGSAPRADCRPTRSTASPPCSRSCSARSSRSTSRWSSTPPAKPFATISSPATRRTGRPCRTSSAPSSATSARWSRRSGC